MIADLLWVYYVYFVLVVGLPVLALFLYRCLSHVKGALDA